MANLGRGEYSVDVFGWDASLTQRVRLLSLDQQITGVKWDRRLNDISQATLDVAVPMGDTMCCQALGDIRTIHHEVDIYRNPGGLVWSGVVTKVAWKRAVVALECKDVLWWMLVRFVRHDLRTDDVDVASMAKTIIESAFSADDPLVTGYVDYRPAGVFGAVAAKQTQFLDAWSLLQKLSQQGLDLTTLGRRIVIGGPTLPFATLPAFTDLDFLSADGIEVVEDSAYAATRVVTLGAAIHGDAGGVDPFYRLVERRFRDKAETDQGRLNQQAKERLAIRNPAPLMVNTPSQAVLSPESDLTIDKLVAGAVTRLDVNHLCRQVSQPMRLQTVEVTKSAGKGEEVGVKLQPLGSAAQAVTEGAGETGTGSV